MKSKLFVLAFLFMSLNMHAQTSRRDFTEKEIKEIRVIFDKSFNTKVPEAIIKELKNYALQNNIEERFVMKNIGTMQVYCNKDLTYAEKKLFLEWAVQLYSSENKMLPLSYFTEALQNLKQ